jgi:hypothetical protein
MMEQPLMPAVVVGIPVDDAVSGQQVKRVVCAAATLFLISLVQVRRGGCLRMALRYLVSRVSLF